MKIADKLFIAIDYCLKLDSGEEVDRSQDGQPLGFIAGTGQIIPGLEKELIGLVAGDNASITVEPEDGYGPLRSDLLKEIPLTQFPEDTDIKPGMAFQAQSPQGPLMLVVKDVQNGNATVDFNHPMAGKRLHFDITVVEVREPSAEELAGVAGCGTCCSSDDTPDCGSGCSCG